jgi:hypothetical protein
MAWPKACIPFALFLLWSPIAASAEEAIKLALPVACKVGSTCFIQSYVDHDPSPAARDYRCSSRTYDGHDGTDFRVPSLAIQRAGVNVLAAAAGVVMGVRDGMADVSVRDIPPSSLQGRECGNGAVLMHGGGWTTRYCHLARGSLTVSKGQRVAVGAPLGRVGLSGNTEFPHLHFSVRLQKQKIDPFAYGAPAGTCGAGKLLWDDSLHSELQFRQREIINLGFAAGPVTMQQIESGEAQHHPPTPNTPALIAYVRAIGLEAGDVIELSIEAPDGSLFMRQREQPLDRAKAQYFVMAGRKRAAAPWPPGVYTARYRILRESTEVLQRAFTVTLMP